MTCKKMNLAALAPIMFLAMLAAPGQAGAASISIETLSSKPERVSGGDALIAVTAPAVFKFTASYNPERHLAAAEAFGVDISQVKKESAGEVLSEALARFLSDLGDQPRGLKAMGFTNDHLDTLVNGTMPQHRVLQLVPNLDNSGGEEQREQLRMLFEEAMEY